MPNNNNTPFTWKDAQWLNTQVTNCVERSTQAVATSAQALALINNQNSGEQLLSKITGVNLNPTISCSYTGLSGTFIVGDTVTDTNGSSADIVTDNGSSQMTLTGVVMNSPETVFAGTIKGSQAVLTFSSKTGAFNVGDTVTDTNGSTATIVSESLSMNVNNIALRGESAMAGTLTGSSGGTATINTYTPPASATVNVFSWGDQVIALSGGSTFIITDIVLTNVSQALTNAADGEWWQSTARTGNQIASELGLPDSLQSQTNVESCANIPISRGESFGGSYNPTSTTSITLGSTFNSIQNTCGYLIYFTVGTPEGIAATCDMYIYGYVLN
jgi:hypothetical protein